MSNRDHSILPEILQKKLEAFGDAISQGRVSEADLDNLILHLDTLSPEKASRADWEIRRLAGLYQEKAEKPCILPFRRSKPTHKELLLHFPGLERLFLFHGDGRLREAALNRIAHGLRSPFFFTAITYRLNDWAPQVRAAAATCADRVFPKTDPDVIARAAMFLLDRKRYWRRWNREVLPLESTLARADVIERLASILCKSLTGPSGSILRLALRLPEIDKHLVLLSTNAFLPSVRAAALGALIDGEARWLGDVLERRWIDKSMGRFHYLPAVVSRPVDRVRPLADLVEQAALDRSAVVRRLASAALLKHHADLPNAEALIARLAMDKSRSIRERIEFLQNRRQETR